MAFNDNLELVLVSALTGVVVSCLFLRPLGLKIFVEVVDFFLIGELERSTESSSRRGWGR